MNEILSHPGVATDTERRIVRLANRLAEAVGEGTPYGLTTLVKAAETYRDAIAGKLGEQVGEHVARIALSTLVDERERESADFWRTPLGRACAWWIGSLDPFVSRNVAAAAIDCSRQNIHELVSKGKLAGSGDAIAPASVRDYLRMRYPLEVPDGPA